MKKSIFILLAISLAAFMTLPALADRKGHGSYHEKSTRNRDDGNGKSRKHDAGDRDGDRRQGKFSERDGDRGQDDSRRKTQHHPPGFRAQPHDRHYVNPHKFKSHEFNYYGHWNSWAAWDEYRKLHPKRFQEGRYYRETGHLFFRFCDPESKGCFFFSIGR